MLFHFLKLKNDSKGGFHVVNLKNASKTCFFSSIYKKQTIFLFCHWNSAKSKKDVAKLILGKDAHVNPSWIKFISNLTFSSIFVYREKTSKILKIFFPQHANMPKFSNILKYGTYSKKLCIYPNLFYI